MFLFRDVTLDMRKEIRATLKQIYGIGFLRAFEACSIVGLRYPFFSNQLNLYNFALLNSILKSLVVSDVRIKRFMELNISNMINLNIYKGIRHKLALPVHGQRTRTNASTQRTKRAKRIIIPVSNKLKGRVKKNFNKK